MRESLHLALRTSYTHIFKCITEIKNYLLNPSRPVLVNFLEVSKDYSKTEAENLKAKPKKEGGKVEIITK